MALEYNEAVNNVNTRYRRRRNTTGGWRNSCSCGVSQTNISLQGGGHGCGWTRANFRVSHRCLGPALGSFASVPQGAFEEIHLADKISTKPYFKNVNVCL